MKSDHYALLIGLGSYPGLIDPPADLKGPEHDVDSLKAWLSAADGGDLPEANIRVIKSSDFPKRQPAAYHLNEQGFQWIEGLAEAKGSTVVGRRLYLYMSGHGFSTVQRAGCLITADAIPRKVDANVCASAWIQYWQDAGYFREFVLLLDACMNRMRDGVPQGAPMAARMGSDPPSQSFIAFAAKRPLKAVEIATPEDDGRFHGVFTWAFLDGLKGAAANAAGVVTGTSMANWLRSALPARFAEADRANPDISQEPEIVSGEALVLARPALAFEFAVEFAFPDDALGKSATLWSGTPARSQSIVPGRSVTLKLAPGLYVLEVPDAGYRQGFDVVRNRTVRVTQKGPPVRQANAEKILPLYLSAGDAANQITIDTAQFETVDGSSGDLDTRLKFGLYRARIRVGNHFGDDQVFLLDRPIGRPEATTGSMLPQGIVESVPEPARLPAMASAVPYRHAPFSHEDQSRLVGAVAQFAPPSAAQIAVVVRSWTDAATKPIAEPWADTRVVGPSGRKLADFTVHAQLSASADPYGHLTLDVAAGSQFLRLPDGAGGIMEMALPTVEGWRLEVYVLRTKTGGHRDPPKISMLMRRPNGENWLREQNDRLEKAMIALSAERPILNDALKDLLVRKFSNPIEGIVGAHLFLIQPVSDRRRDPSLMDEVVTNLRRLVGTEHGDVEALSLLCVNPKLRRTKPLESPPIFERSWRLLLAAARKQPDLIPLALWKRVAARVVAPPYLAWSVDQSVKRRLRSTLVKAARTVESVPAAPPAAAPESASMAAVPRSRKALLTNAYEANLESLSPVEVGREHLAEAETTERRSPRGSKGSGRSSKIIDAHEWLADAYQLPPSALAALREKINRRS